MTEIPTGDTAGRPPAGEPANRDDGRGSAPAPDTSPAASSGDDAGGSTADAADGSPAAKRRRNAVLDKMA